MPSPEKQEHVFGKNTMSGTRRAKLEALRKRENDRAKEGRKQQLEAKKRPGPRRGSKSQPLAALPMSASAPALAAAAAAAAAAAPAVAAAAPAAPPPVAEPAGPRGSADPKAKLKVLEKVAGTLASDWSLLDAYNILEYQRSEKSKQERKRADRDRMKMELRMQLAKKEEYLRLKAINDKRQVADIRRQNEEWEKEARDEKAARVAALNREIAAREAMAKSRIDETLRRKALKDRQDLEELEKVKREIAEEEVKQKQRVVNERLRLEAIMAENVKEKAIREKAKHDQWEADKRQMIEYQKGLDRTAAAREAEKAAKKKMLDDKAHHFETSDQAKEMQVREAKEKAYIECELAKQAKAVEDRHVADREKIRREKELIKRDNDALIAHKSKLRAQEEEEKARMFVYLKNSAKENEEQQDKLQEMKTMRKNEHYKKLQRQIEACRSKRTNYNMTEKERSLNEDRIRKLKALAQEDPKPIVDVLSVFPVRAGVTRPAPRGRIAPKSEPVKPPVEKPPAPRRPAPFRLDTDVFISN